MSENVNERAVLVVDDDAFVLRTTALTLASMGFGVVRTAESAEEAERIIDSADPTIEVVLLDLNMPGVDGVELLRRFDERQYAGDVVLVSGEDAQTLEMAEALARSRHLSVLGAIQKPVTAERLSTLLFRNPSSATGKPSAPRLREITPEQLRDALAGGAIVPWFQPKVSVARQVPTGVEALARWPTSESGPVFPDEFIPVAEQAGLIDELTFAMVEQSVTAAEVWRARGFKLKLAVNVSMDSLHFLDFPEKLCARIEAAGGDPTDLQLEVTESRLTTDFVPALDVLLRLRLRRISLAIDDFGTGNSNFEQLQRLPFDEVKLDRTYVAGAASSKRDAAILESAAAVAKKMDVRVVAEGVETLDDWRRVEELGCDEAQGYFLAKPMPAEEVPGWVADWPRRRAELFSGPG